MPGSLKTRSATGRIGRRASDATETPRPAGVTTWTRCPLLSTGQPDLLDSALCEILKEIPLGLVVAEAPGGRVLSSSRRLAEIYGWSDDEAVGSSLAARRGFHRDGHLLQAGEWPLEQTLQNGTPGLAEQVEIECPGGARKQVRVSSSPVRDPSGRLVAALEVTADITESVRHEEAIRTSEQRFRTITDNLPDIVARFDQQGRFLYVNAAIERLTGMVPEHLIGKTKAEAGFPSHMLERWEASLRRVFSTGQSVSMDFEYLSPGGAIWFEHRIVPEFGPAGDVSSALVVGRDVTDRQRTEDERRRLSEQLADQKRQIDTVVESMADGLAVYGQRAEILRINATAEHLLGLSGEQQRLPLDERLRLLRAATLDGKPLASENDPVLRALRGETVHGEVLIFDGPAPLPRRWVSTSTVPIRNLEGSVTLVVASFADVTRLHELQEQRDDLLRMISHDLRTPLSSLLLQAQMLQRSLAPADRNNRRVETIIANGQRLANMIRDLVEMVRLESGQMQMARKPLDVPKFLLKLKERLAGTLAVERVQITYEPDLPSLLADPDRLERVVVNLLSNALKYSDPATDVGIHVSLLDGYITIAVSDRGSGIAREELPYLFERFYRSHETRRQEGLGLGLYIAAMLVKAHGGTIEVQSELGKGSVFRAKLPVDIEEPTTPD